MKKQIIIALLAITTIFGCKKEVDLTVKGISLSKSSLSLKPGDTATLVSTILPLNATNKAVTWASSDTTIAKVANGLIALGVLPNDRIAYLGKNTDLYWEILFGANKCRATMAAINNRLAAPELKFILSDSDAVALFVSHFEVCTFLLFGRIKSS